MKEKRNLSDYWMLYTDIAIYSFVSVLAKFAALQHSLVVSALLIGGEVFLLGIYAIIWQQILKKFDLSVSISSKGITVVLVLVWSTWFFHEVITLWNILGAIVIIAGLYMVSKDE